MKKQKVILNPYFEAKNSKNNFSEDSAPSGAGDAFYLEPLLAEILIHFNKLMLAYQADEEEK